MVSSSGKLHKKLKNHHEFQQKILDRVDKSKQQFTSNTNKVESNTPE